MGEGKQWSSHRVRLFLHRLICALPGHLTRSGVASLETYSRPILLDMTKLVRRFTTQLTGDPWPSSRRPTSVMSRRQSASPPPVISHSLSAAVDTVSLT